MYALNLDEETGRILSATFPRYATSGMPMVDELPEGNIGNWLYKDGEYVYDPLPEEEIPDETTIEDLEGKVVALEEQNETLLQCILEMSEIVYA